MDTCIHACTGNNIRKAGRKVLGEYIRDAEQQRYEKKNLRKQAISLILLSHQLLEESSFHVLPLEIVHMIIRFLLDGIPVAALYVVF